VCGDGLVVTNHSDYLMMRSRRQQGWRSSRDAGNWEHTTNEPRFTSHQVRPGRTLTPQFHSDEQLTESSLRETRLLSTTSTDHCSHR